MGSRGLRPTCRLCHAFIKWARTKAGKWTPVDEDGTTHWATCRVMLEVARKRKERLALRRNGTQVSMGL